MKNSSYFILFILLIWSCENKPSLQNYFVKNSESSNFVTVDVPNTIINTSKTKMSLTDKAALQSFEKMNILTYQTDLSKIENYEKEVAEVKTLLKDKTYQELMKIGSGASQAAVFFVGEEQNIDEFVFFASKKENGFAVVRVLGNNMNPTHVMNILQLVQKSEFDAKQLEPLRELLGNNSN